MHKFTKFLLMIIFVLIIIYFILNNYVSDMEHENMASKVGTRSLNAGVELTVNEYSMLAQCFETYSDYIAKKDYKTAYMMLGVNYRNYMPYEEYEEKIKSEKIEEMSVHNIDIITNTTFDILVGNNEDEKHYSIIINNEKNTFSLYPDSFLDYNKNEKKLSKSKVEYILKDYIVNIDKCIINLEITNKNKKPIIISKSILKTKDNKEYDNTEKIEIPSKETKQISISFDTEYEFPKNIIIENNIKNIEMQLD